MITLEQAKNLSIGDIITDELGKKWRVNGKVKTWKRDSTRVQVPLKQSLFRYGYLTQDNLQYATKA